MDDDYDCDEDDDSDSFLFVYVTGIEICKRNRDDHTVRHGDQNGFIVGIAFWNTESFCFCDTVLYCFFDENTDDVYIAGCDGSY